MKELFLQCLLLVLFSTSALDASVGDCDSYATPLSSDSDDYSLSFFVPVLGLDDTLQFKIDDCAAAVDICIAIPIDELNNYQITNNGQPYANGIAGCDFDTLNSYNYTNLFGQGTVGPYILQSWTVNGSIFSAPFNSIDELVDSMNVWDPTGNWTHDDANNLIIGGSSGGSPGDDYSDMVVWSAVIGASAILTRMDEISTQGTALNFSLGANEIIVTDNLNGGSDTVIVQVACLNVASLNENVLVGESDDICLDFDELLGDVSTVTNLCAGSNVQFQLINSDSCVSFTGLTVGVDTACFEACDVFGFCDTTLLIVNSQPLTGTHNFFDTIYTATTNTFCVNTALFPGTPDTIYNICPTDSGTFTSFSLNENTFCVDYFGVASAGTDMACIVVCDEFDICDTTMMHITVKRLGPLSFADTILINENVSYCDFDISNLDGNLTSMTNGCPGASGTHVFFDFDFNSLCANYEGIGEGIDTACIYFMDDLGKTDTTFMFVTVVPPSSTVLYDTIRLGLTPEYCVDTTQLFGNIVSIENVCPTSSGTEVSFTIDAATFCVEAEALMIGTDTACIVICDDLGVCDTSIFIITVEEENFDAPIALDDLVSVAMNTEMPIDVCANDTIPANLPMTDFFVLPLSLGGAGPLNGVAISDNDCIISYIPDDEFCGLDSISYVICNMAGCDTALVQVSVACPTEELKIFNGFSPNDDGVNDFFKINGLENFPNHELFIYNRWGLEVFNTTGYLSDWEGTWDGNDLPDGTYFYVLDDGEGEVHSGYVYIHR